MGNIKDKFLAKIENGGNKKSIENLVVFVIILIATIIFINYIWNGDKKNDKNKSQNVNIDKELFTEYLDAFKAQGLDVIKEDTIKDDGRIERIFVVLKKTDQMETNCL